VYDGNEHDPARLQQELLADAAAAIHGGELRSVPAAAGPQSATRRRRACAGIIRHAAR
jgi:hypothetical protein